jgi:hypothetical protein
MHRQDKMEQSTAKDDDFQEVKIRKRHISSDTSEPAKKTTKSIPISTDVKQTLKAVPTRNFYAPLKTNDMDTKTTGAENTLTEQGAS